MMNGWFILILNEGSRNQWLFYYQIVYMIIEYKRRVYRAKWVRALCS